MLLARTVAPADFISDAELKAHLRIDHTYEDDFLTAIRAAVMAHLDGRNGYLQRAICDQTWTWKLPRFPVSSELHIPLPPLRSITSITYQDASDATQTFAGSEYYVLTDDLTGYVKLKAGSGWPGTYERDDAVTVTFVAGYGDADAVPAPIKQAALLIAGHLYATRGDADASAASRVMDDTTRMLLAPYRVQEFNLPHERYWHETRANPLRPPV